ncbi:GntP family permease [Fulvimarina sp. MAC8]|uniref:GntP family permease n=1 Tax=Fulvimarina sp. MAC8 TaxID=3162874 RepID=UPI0032EDDE6B
MSGIFLILLLVLAIAFIVVGTAKFHIHPFLILLVASYGLGLFAGISPADTIEALVAGFGETIGEIGIIIAAGTIIGVALERTGGAQVMADTVVRAVGKARTVLSMSITGSVVSIPVFFDSGYVILSPLARSLAAKSGTSMVTYALALSMGLMATHIFVPPTPGPVAAAGSLGADLGIVILLGLVVTVPVVAVSYFYAIFMGNRYYIDPESISVTNAPDVESEKTGPAPSPFRAFLPILLPIVLISLNSIATFEGSPLGEGLVYSILTFIGDPNTALLIGAFTALYVTVSGGGKSITQDAVMDALRVAGPIILITGAGGALGGVLQATPITDFLANNLALSGLGLGLPFLLAAALKTAQGSSTVAIVTTASIIAPLAGSLGLESSTDLALATLAIGSGSAVVAHANDSGFWVVTQFSGMSVSEGYKFYTTATLIAGITGIITVLLLSLIL